jgi:hypothetical protein
MEEQKEMELQENSPLLDQLDQMKKKKVTQEKDKEKKTLQSIKKKTIRRTKDELDVIRDEILTEVRAIMSKAFHTYFRKDGALDVNTHPISRGAYKINGEE